MSHTIANYSINGANPSTVGGTGTAQKLFPNLPGPSIGVANVTPSATSAAGQLLVKGSNSLNGQEFEVLASGNFLVGAGGASGTVTIQLMANIGTVTTPAYRILATTGAFAAEALDGVYYPWSMKVSLEGDTLSGIVQGTQRWTIDNTAVPTTAGTASLLTNVLTGINFTTEAPFGLVMGITFGTSETGNLANMYRFSIEQ